MIGNISFELLSERKAFSTYYNLTTSQPNNLTHMSDWKSRLGVVYSTNPDFQFTTEDDLEVEQDTLPPAQQKLRVRIERAGRKGKTVTLVTGFVGSEDDLKQLGKLLKTKLSTGGTAKDGEIVIQGDVRQPILELLHKEGYTQAK